MPKACSVCGSTEGKERVRKMCEKCYYKWHYRQNKERYIKRADEWKKNNYERYLEIQRRARRRARAKLTKAEKQEINRREWIARKARMTEADWEKRRQYLREYYQEHKDSQAIKEQRKQAKQRRRGKERKLIADLTEEQWQAILKSHQYRCAYCGKKHDKLTQDHIVPVVKNGAYTMHNIVPACLKCNQKKSSGPPPVPVQPTLI